jgi:beta-ureidopropionase
MLRTLIVLALAASLQPAAFGAPRNPIARVVTVSEEYLEPAAAGTLAEMLERLERAASFRPDIAALPEVFIAGEPEVVPGPVTNKLAEWARKHNSYVVYSLHTLEGGRKYNTATLLDRAGRVVGRYRKAHPTENELAKGIHPGDKDPPVFETDFGRIGVQICFDVNWWDSWKRLKEKGAKIVFFLAAYPAARQLSTLALTNQFYVVSSSRSRLSRIYDITGEELAVSGRFQPWAGAALPLGKRLFEIDFHTAKARDIQKKYGTKVEVNWYHEDDWFTLASLDPDLTVEDLIAEFGLLPLDDYRIRAARAIEKARAAVQ